MEINKLNNTELVYKIADAVSKLPFGEHAFLPVCRESFPRLDELMKVYEKRSAK